MKDICVSIICNAYNHEKYIKDALEGFIMQKTSFPFEVLIHDDASTDNTANIIHEYEKKYPKIIKPIYQTENQFSKGKGMVGKIQYARVKGKYIAICEGDDYWIDPYKLQKQYDALEAHPEISICATAAYAIKANTKKTLYKIAPANCKTIIRAEDIILGGGGYVATASLMYRSSINNKIPKYRAYLNLDYTLQIQGSIPNGMIFLNETTVAYRLLSDNSWTKKQKNNVDKQINIINKIINMLNILNEDTNSKYNDVITKVILNKEFDKLILTNDYLSIKNERYKKLYNNLSTIKKAKIKIKHYFPWLLKIKRYINGRKYKI